MQQAQATMDVRQAGPNAAIIDMHGQLTAAAEDTLMESYARASETNPKAIILNFEGLEYMNSSGIGLLVTLLIRINRSQQKLLTYGLSEHYRHIFELTRLNDAIGVYDTEADALRAAATP